MYKILIVKSYTRDRCNHLIVIIHKAWKYSFV